MDPYRSAPREEVIEAPRDRGIVGDVIDQFADPLAFYRELIQNSIDAGTPSVDVSISYDDAAGVARATVRDRGEGMTQDILENNLLVLFRSTKEKDDTKIGKFGIGFKSVLAPDPRLVVVTTVRDGKRLIVHLRPDLSYAMFDGGGASLDGTSVELELPVAAGDVPDLVTRTESALARWCRHATVPITFSARGPGGAVLAAETRIDRPLALDGALVEARASFDDGRLTVVVGVTADGHPYGGFFNHGLTLYETNEPLAGRLVFKVQDSRLGHTLSRDNVRRDAAFDHALDRVRTVAGRELVRAAVIAVRGAAEDPDRRRWRALVDALLAAEIELTEEEWAFPLIAPVAEQRVVMGAALGRDAWGGRGGSTITDMITANGTPVIDLGDSPGDVVWTIGVIRRLTGCLVVDAETSLTRVVPVERSGADERFCEALSGLLDDVYRRPSAIVLAELEGALGAAYTVTGGRDADATRPWLLHREGAERSPFELIGRGPLVLNTLHERIVAARRRAEVDPVNAASLVARALLLRFAKLDLDRSDELLARTLARLDVAGVG